MTAILKALKKYDPVSYWSVKQEQKQRMKDWRNTADPLKVFAYDVLKYVKMVLIALVVYIFILTITECLYGWENLTDNAFGSTKESRPWIKKSPYQISSNQNPNSELSFVTINM